MATAALPDSGYGVMPSSSTQRQQVDGPMQLNESTSNNQHYPNMLA